MKKNQIIILVIIALVVGFVVFSGQGKNNGSVKNNQVPDQSANVSNKVNNQDSQKDNQNSQNNQVPQNSQDLFKGEKGSKVSLINGQVELTESIFNDNLAHFYNISLGGQNIYFFVVKDKNGIYRAAANACAVCFRTYKGFRQEGNEIVCNNCGNRYPIEKIATEKGGCNPGPINPNLEVKGGKIIITQSDLEKVLELF